MTGFRCAADSDHQVQADRSLDVCCRVVRTGACDPKRSPARSLASVCFVRERSLDTGHLDEVWLQVRMPVSGRWRGLAIDPLPSFE